MLAHTRLASCMRQISCPARGHMVIRRNSRRLAMATASAGQHHTAGASNTCRPGASQPWTLGCSCAMAAVLVLVGPLSAADARSIQEIKDAVQQDFVANQYYVTGQLTRDIYEPDCRFVDPTTNVKGVEPYTRAVATLFDPAESRADLVDIQVTDPQTITLHWRLEGKLRIGGLRIKPYTGRARHARGFPTPTSADAATGTTRYTVDQAGLISSHEETWDISAVDANPHFDASGTAAQVDRPMLAHSKTAQLKLSSPRPHIGQKRHPAVRTVCRATSMPSGQANVLVVAGRSTPELSVLEKLPAGVRIVGVGQSVEDLASLSEQDWASIDVLLNCGVGPNAGKREHIQSFWSKLTGLKWIHSASAGLEHLLWPDLVQSSVQLTNAKGVYSHSLAEFALASCNYFAKDFPRLAAAKAQHNWEPYDVEELRGKTLGIVGYGDIGQACAQLGRAFKMRVVAMRRRATLSEKETQEGILSALYTPEQLPELMAASDYVVAALPHTPGTHELVNAAAIAAMKPNGVFVNVGRGKTVEEPALVTALQEGRIRGAALDVFYTEPLPKDSSLWDLPNVLVSPHCADRTKEFQHESIELFVENMRHYLRGEPLLNVCDKEKGY